MRPPAHAYVTQIEDFELLPGALEGMERLASCAYRLVVVSNQRGISRGLVTEEALRATETALQAALRPLGAEIEGFYYCPHEIADDCDCRKPKPGLLIRAAAELDLDLETSWMIGDSPSDVEAGASAGCRTAYLRDGAEVPATLIADSLEQAAEAICRL